MAPAPVELIDGKRLCDLLRKSGLGVKKVERWTIDEAFFKNL